MLLLVPAIDERSYGSYTRLENRMMLHKQQQICMCLSESFMKKQKSLRKKYALKSLEKGDLTLNNALRIRLPVAFHNGLFLSELDIL